MAGAARGRAHLPRRGGFRRPPAQSIDYAVMEKADRVAVVPVAMGWSDVGSWDALHALAERAEDGTVRQARCWRSTAGLPGPIGRTTGVTIGVSDLIVVATADGVLIVPRGQSQRVKEAVEALARRQTNRPGRGAPPV